MIEFYTYIHCKPDGTPFYVGKGSARRSHDFRHRNRHHEFVVAKYGAENISVLVFPRASEQLAFDDEVKWICVLREAGYDLANKTTGGQGASGAVRSVETRLKISSVHKGRKRSPETCARIAKAKAGFEMPKGAKERIALYRTGKTLSDESRAKVSTAKKGRPNGWGGKTLSPEHRAKISSAQKGRTVPLARRQKMSVSAKARWAGQKLNHHVMTSA